MARPVRIFVSYSHKDEAFKEALLEHLSQLRREGVIAPWTDRDLVPGEEWESTIFCRLAESDLVLFLVSSSFLASDFCSEREVPRALELHEKGSLKVVPVAVRPCDWKRSDFAKFQGLPKDAKPVSKWDDADDAWLDVVRGIRRAISGSPEPQEPPPPPPLGTILISTSGLPASGAPVLVGRDAELKVLDDAWDDPDVRAITFVAIGGAGKTTLVDHWLQSLERDRWRGADAVFAWSFYSQGGGDDRQATGDAFVNEALRFFGEAKRENESARDRGLRLARLVRARRTLLVLDGLEPIQEPPNSGKAGRIKDPAVAALVRELASTQPGLLVITTREPVADLANRVETSAPSHDLERLSDPAGADLLRRLGVEGRDDELEEVAREMRGHCLGITLLGTYLRRACQGDVRKWRDLPFLDATKKVRDNKAFRVMELYAEWFGGPERQILSMLGLFDRPADADALGALRKEPAIPGLTDRVVDLPSTEWNEAITSLREARLLLDDPTGKSQALDAHPLVREHFGRVLEEGDPDAYRAGHARLYEHYAALAPDLPDTFEEMQPLYRAVHHGCRAGRQQETFDEVYAQRILRNNEFYSVRKLGAFGSDLAAVSAFFERTWDRPTEELCERDRAWLLNHAAFCLRALGRLHEAVPPMEASLERLEKAKGWEGAATVASNLSELALTLGRVDDAMRYGKSSVELADRSEDDFLRIGFRTTWAEAQHAAGRLDEAESAFLEAESIQAELQPQYPKLYSVQGYRFCDLLLDRGRCEEVRERAAQTLEWDTPFGRLLDNGIHNLSLGRAHLRLALLDGQELEDATASLDRAIEGFRKAGYEDHLPSGLIARANLHRYRKDVSAAEADLEEALEIAERALMKLHECDVHLEWGRLRLSAGDQDDARKHLERAAALVEETGYHRRDREIQELREASS